MTTSFSSDPTFAEQFANAWTDLGDRLSRALAAVEVLVGVSTSDVERERLTAKRDGLAAAVAVYTDLLDEAADGEEGPFWAWQQQRDKVFVAYCEAMESGEGQKGAGLAVALDHMRGYSYTVDIPSLNVLLVGNR